MKRASLFLLLLFAVGCSRASDMRPAEATPEPPRLTLTGGFISIGTISGHLADYDGMANLARATKESYRFNGEQISLFLEFEDTGVCWSDGCHPRLAIRDSSGKLHEDLFGWVAENKGTSGYPDYHFFADQRQPLRSHRKTIAAGPAALLLRITHQGEEHPVVYEYAFPFTIDYNAKSK